MWNEVLKRQKERKRGREWTVFFFKKKLYNFDHCFWYNESKKHRSLVFVTCTTTMGLFLFTLSANYKEFRLMRKDLTQHAWNKRKLQRSTVLKDLLPFDRTVQLVVNNVEWKVVCSAGSWQTWSCQSYTPKNRLLW